MDRDLSIQEIRLLAAYKTNNPNISEQEAVRIMNSVLPDYENKVNSWGIQSTNQSAFGSNIVVSGLTECDTAQIVCNNLFQKLGFVQPKATEIQPVQVPPSEPTADEIKFFAIDYLQNDLDKALSIYNTRINTQGAVSNIFNSGKELFNTDFASSRVGRILANEQLGAELLQRAAENNLTEKEYLQAKLDLAVKLLGADSKDAKYLQAELGKLEPSKLNEFISKVLTLSDEDYAVQIPQIKENLLANNAGFSDRLPILNIVFKNPNSVASLIEHEASKPMDFETTFLKERGVSYNPEAIRDYTEKQAYLSLLLSAQNRIAEIRNLLDGAITAVEGNNNYGGHFYDATGACVNNLERRIIQALTSLYGNDTDKINEVLKQNNATFKDGKIDCLNKSYTLVNISKNIQANLDSNVKNLLNGKTIPEYEAECKRAYNLAYGEENGTRLAEAFVESQVKGVQAIKMGVQGVGILVSLAGSIFATIPAALSYGVVALGTFGGAAVQIAEDATKTGGITEEDKKAIIQEIATSAALLAAGGAIDKVSSFAFAKMVMTNCPRTLSYATKYGMDVVLGAVADMAITGDYNITQETITNLMPIIIGVTRSKGSMMRFVQNEMLDAVGTLPRDYFRTHPQEFDRVMNIMLDNHTHLGYLSKLDDTYWNEIIKSSQKPPVGEQYKAMMVYKENSWGINTFLSCKKAGKPLPPELVPKRIELENYYKHIESYINTTSLKQPIVTYRDTDGFKLRGVTLFNNINLGDKLDALYKELLEAKKTLSIEQVNNVKNKIKDFETKLKSEKLKFTFTQERFMSTTFVKENRFDTKKSIRFEFNLPEGTKGTFIESYNDKFKNGTQIEYLLQRDTKIIINDIQWSDEFNCWYIKASVSQD